MRTLAVEPCKGWVVDAKGLIPALVVIALVVFILNTLGALPKVSVTQPATTGGGVVISDPPQKTTSNPPQNLNTNTSSNTTSQNQNQNTNTNSNNVQTTNQGQGNVPARWPCPGDVLSNKCMLHGSADLVEGLCIDFDPG